MKSWIVHYYLKNGGHGTINVIAATGWAAKQVCHKKIAGLILEKTHAEEIER